MGSDLVQLKLNSFSFSNAASAAGGFLFSTFSSSDCVRPSCSFRFRCRRLSVCFFVIENSTVYRCELLPKCLPVWCVYGVSVSVHACVCVCT